MNTPTDKERLELYNRFRNLRYIADIAVLQLDMATTLPADYIETINNFTRIAALVSTITDAIIQRGMDALAASAPKTEVLQR